MTVGIVYTIKDAKGAKSTTAVNLPSGTTLADALEFAEELGQLIANVVTGKITTIGVHFSVSVAALTGNALGSNICFNLSRWAYNQFVIRLYIALKFTFDQD